MVTPAEIEAGQSIYSLRTLRWYDWFVLGLSNSVFWRCSTTDLRRLYDCNVTGRHLDVGVGTGYFLDHARWPVAEPAITLLDLNADCLTFAARRLERYTPQTIIANVVEPLPPIGPFSSVGLCYLLHCLPGNMAAKAIAFDLLRPLLSPNARVFGATIVQGDAPRSRAAQAVMDLYNRRGIFSNADDTIDALDLALRQRFDEVNIELKGAVAVFEGRFVGTDKRRISKSGSV
ncbi:MAG: class I SAM-dependent methyltransferase [Alphaproteobacteria bacterium]